MMPELSRRTVVKALGASAVGMLSPANALASIPQPRSLESIIGAERLERAKFLWSLPEWPHHAPGGLVDAANQFRMTPAFRKALTAIVNGCNAVIFDPEDVSGDWKLRRRRDYSVLALLSYLDVLPRDLSMGEELDENWRATYRYFVAGDAWRQLGWEEPWKYVSDYWQPDPIWMMTGRTHPDSPLPFKLLANKLGWEDIDVVAALEQSLEDKKRFPD